MRALLTLTALLSVVSLYIALVSAPMTKAAPVAAKAMPVFTMDTALMTVVIVVPPTQVVNPLTGTKDDQTNVMWSLLNGWVADQADNDLGNVRYVQYPQSVWWLTGPSDPTADKSRDIGGANLNQLIEAASGQPIVVVGYSQGSSVNTRWLNWYKEGKIPNAPDPSELSFVSVGNPNRPNGGPAERFAGIYVPILGVTFDGATPSNTPYSVTEVAHEYDGISDFPVYVLNPFADINALMGMPFVHAFYDQIDLNDPSNIVTHDGNLTDVLVHTSVLPIMQPLYIAAHLAGRTETPVLDAISGPLRVIIDSAYDRTTAKATPANFGNPFQNVDTAALKESITQSAEMLLHGTPETVPSRTFTQFPDLRGVVKTLTTSPMDMPAVNRAAVQSAENFLYGMPKMPAATSPSVNKEPEPEAAVTLQPKDESVTVEADSPPVNKKPITPKLPSLGTKPATAHDSTSSTSTNTPSSQPTKPGWKPGDGLKAIADRLHKLTHGGTAPSSKPDKVGASPSSSEHSDNDGDGS
jgi:hypothetical protein